MNDSVRIGNLLSELRELGFHEEANVLQKKVTSRIYVGDFFEHVRSGNRYVVQKLTIEGAFIIPMEPIK
jgi:hypothetical protein